MELRLEMAVPLLQVMMSPLTNPLYFELDNSHPRAALHLFTLQSYCSAMDGNTKINEHHHHYEKMLKVNSLVLLMETNVSLVE